MNLQSLIFCSDDKVVRLLRRVLNDMEVGIETCPDPDSAIRKLTRQRFESVIVDCQDQAAAATVLKSVQFSPVNRRAITVAICEGGSALRGSFDLGSHFALLKPITPDRARATFRAVRALMKRERRRNTRIAVQIPVALIPSAGAEIRTTSTDLSEGGISVQLSQRPKDVAGLRVRFDLPGTEFTLESKAEIAWENSGLHKGIRFVDLASETQTELNSWISRHSQELEPDDPPSASKLTDLSLNGCYLELMSPFPVRTRLSLSMRVTDLQVRVDGIVRVMHPEGGMGVEFTQRTAAQREQVEKFIHALTKSSGASPELMVEPDCIDNSTPTAPTRSAEHLDDPLLALFLRTDLSSHHFQLELKKQRGGHHTALAASV